MKISKFNKWTGGFTGTTMSMTQCLVYGSLLNSMFFAYTFVQFFANRISQQMVKRNTLYSTVDYLCVNSTLVVHKNSQQTNFNIYIKTIIQLELTLGTSLAKHDAHITFDA
jgi:hypothetical protein